MNERRKEQNESQTAEKRFDKLIKELKLSALQITMAKILLRENGREAMLKYLESIAQEKAG